MSQVIVVGGGAAGMMAAYAAAKNGHMVTLLERNEKLGKKIYITGKGRCNLTNACDTVDFFDRVIHNPKFLYSAVYGFDANAVMEFMEDYGCRVKVERGDRVFPVSDHASDVINALKRAMQQVKVTVRLNCGVKELIIEEEQIKGVITDDGQRMSADDVIVATGGLSYASTGSTGDGYRFAGSAGLEVTDLRPSLVALFTGDSWVPRLQGLSLKNIKGSLFLGNKCLYEEQGEMLFTHFGVSGPLILSASAYMGKALRKGKKGTDNQHFRFVIDLKPALTEEQLDKRILRDFEGEQNKEFRNALGGLLPAKMIPIIVALSGIDGNKKVHQVEREERLTLVHLLKHLECEVTGTGPYSEAVITQGGIPVKEINPSTMESRKIRNLYFAGEVLDVDALTGGYNLQIAWSTGYLAGDSIK